MFNVLILFLLCLTTFISFIAGFMPIKLLRFIIITFFSVLSLGISVYYLVSMYTWQAIVSLSILLIQFFNIFRIVNLRYQKNSIKRVFMSGILLFSILIIFELLLLTGIYNSYYLLSGVVFIMGSVGLLMIRVNTIKVMERANLADKDLPTVSVLIPARNEDSQLAECIESVIASDYPKLEVIVLDDCSQDNSSEIIKSFASKGVRFIQGKQPEENWLAKNQAYQALAESASGDWYMFMGVDVRLDKKTIRTLMTEVLNNKLLMAGVLPNQNNSKLSSLFLPLRYYWELVLPLFVMRHPPAISTCWIIHDEALKSCGGFGAVSQSVLPERYFALKMKKNHKYAFFRNSDDLYVSTNKTYQDQIEASERLLYPQLKKSVFRLALMFILSLCVIVSYFLLIKALIDKDYQLSLILFIGLLPILISHIVVSALQGMQYKVLRALILPYVLTQELIIAVTSAYKYEFSEVIWKGRNVCYPNLKVIPRLPKI